MSLHSTFNNQIYVAIVLSIVLLTHGTSGRQNLGAYMTAVTGGAARQEVVVPQVLLKELLANANEDALYSELKKYHRQQPNYLSKWPGLRDLLLTSDYDDNAGSESNEVLNSHFLERLRQMATSSSADMMEDAREENFNWNRNELNDLSNGENHDAVDIMPTTGPLKKLSSSGTLQGSMVGIKDHGTKKNVQYMSPCHFKICNMGRKRNARYFSSGNY